MLTQSCRVKSEFYLMLILMNLLPQNKRVLKDSKDFLDFKLVVYQRHDRGGHQRDEIYIIH